MSCEQEKEHSYRLEKLDEKMEKGEETLIEYGRKIDKIDESVKSAHKRIDEVGEIPKAVLKMSIAVENMAAEIKEIATSMKEHQDKINERVTVLENKPGGDAYKLQKQIFGYVVAIAVAFVLGKFGIK